MGDVISFCPLDLLMGCHAKIVFWGKECRSLVTSFTQLIQDCESVLHTGLLKYLANIFEIWIKFTANFLLCNI